MSVPPTSEPLVSVIIPVYGTARFVAQSIDSVLAQTYRRYEIIVVNDGSPDSSLLDKVIEPYLGRIKYIVQENRGLSCARNVAIQVARGEYIAILDSDDYWSPDYLASQVAVLDGDPTIDVVYPDAIWFSADGRTTSQFSREHPVGGDISFLRVLARECQIYGGATVRRDALSRVGSYDEGLRTGEDFDLWVRILKAGGRIAYNDHVLAYYRERPGSLTSDRLSLVRNMVKLLDRLGTKVELTADERAALDRQRSIVAARLSVAEGKQALLAGDSRTALAKLTGAFQQRKSWKVLAIIFSLRIAPGLLLQSYRVRDWWQSPRAGVQE